MTHTIELKNCIDNLINYELNIDGEIVNINNNEEKLKIDEDIINHLYKCIDNNDIGHKILKLKNLIDINLYNDIINGFNENLKQNEKRKENGENEYFINIENVNFDKIEKNNLCVHFEDFYEHIKNNKNEKENYILYLEYNQKTCNICNICNQYKTHYFYNLQNPGTINNVFDLNDYLFILGSTSISRKFIMEKNNLNFLTIKIKIDEKKIGYNQTCDPLTLISNISLAKAIKLFDTIKKNTKLKNKIYEIGKNKKIILIVGDEILCINNKIYEKPNNKEEVINFIKTYSNNESYSYCSVVLIDLNNQKIINGIDKTIININNINDTIIQKILKDKSIYLCAGALKIEHEYIYKNVNKINGTMDNILGLSVNLLLHLLSLI